MDIEHEMLGSERVVISLKDFEDMLDLITYDNVKSTPQEAFPATLSAALIAGTNPLKAYRKHRGLSQAALSTRAQVPQGLISEIETSKKTGSVTTLKALAKALNIYVDDLIA